MILTGSSTIIMKFSYHNPARRSGKMDLVEIFEFGSFRSIHMLFSIESKF